MISPFIPQGQTPLDMALAEDVRCLLMDSLPSALPTTTTTKVQSGAESNIQTEAAVRLSANPAGVNSVVDLDIPPAITLLTMHRRQQKQKEGSAEATNLSIALSNQQVVYLKTLCFGDAIEMIS